MGTSSRGASRPIQRTLLSQVRVQCSCPDALEADDIRECTSEVNIEIDNGPTSSVAVVPAVGAVADEIGCRSALTRDGTSPK